MSLYCLVMDNGGLGRILLELFIGRNILYLFRFISMYIFYKIVFEFLIDRWFEDVGLFGVLFNLKKLIIFIKGKVVIFL